MPPPPVGPCGDLGTVTNISVADDLKCELAPGAVIEFELVAGHGGAGGSGGNGGAGGQGWDGTPCSGPNVPGGAGGAGGVGAAGGLGAAFRGTYANSTGTTLTLLVVAGNHGANGAIGANGSAGAPAPTSCVQLSALRVNVTPMSAANGADGAPGQDGSDGQAGGEAGLYLVNPNSSLTPLVVATGGGGGTGGVGGGGGQGGRSNGAAGAPGSLGPNGFDGVDGTTDPNPLGSGMTLMTHDGNPRAALAGGTPPAAVLPPGISDLVTQPVAPSTTEVPLPTTTVPPTVRPPTTTVPAPVPFEGALPAMTPGAGQVSQGGVLTPVEVFVDDRTDLVMQGQDFELRLRGECASGCSIETTAEGREVVTLEERGLARVSGEGFLPGSTVYVWLFSEPRFLGELTVGADGTFTGVVPLGDIAVGEHTLQANGTSFDGVARSANLGVLVNPAALPTPAAGELPSTGSNATPMVLLALVLLGFGAVAVGRRPRPIGE